MTAGFDDLVRQVATPPAVVKAKPRRCAHRWATTPLAPARSLKIAACCIRCGETRTWTFTKEGEK